MVEGIRDPEEVDISDAGATVLATLRKDQGKDSSEDSESGTSVSDEELKEAKKQEDAKSEEAKAKEDEQTKLEAEPDDVKKLRSDLSEANKKAEETGKALKRVQEGKYSADKGLSDRMDQLEADKKAEKEAKIADVVHEDDDDPVTKKDLRLASKDSAKQAVEDYKAEIQKDKDLAKAIKLQDQVKVQKEKYKEHYQPRVDLVDAVCKENPVYYEAIQRADDPAAEAMRLAELHPDCKELIAKVKASDTKLKEEGKEKPKIDPKKVEKIIKNAQRPPTSAGVSGGGGRSVGGSDKFNKAKNTGRLEDWADVIEDVNSEALEKMRLEDD
ncbi:hypothetical protein IID24_02735 [Patescibacteria group bacterium]|nr:hypothetical protein [Patescibacteria group bacterium]